VLFHQFSSKTIQIIVVVFIYRSAFFAKYFGLKELVLKLFLAYSLKLMPGTDLRHVTFMVNEAKVYS